VGDEPIDPIRFEVLRNALVEVTEEMSAALRRSAFSTNIKTRADFSCALFDADLAVIAQAFNQADHLGSLSQSVPLSVRAYGAELLRPGDALLTNDPELGGTHLNDITLISPVFADGELWGYVANLAHHVDVGGGAPASIGVFREIFQEGVIIPPVRLVRDHELDDDVFRLVLAQVRSKRETRGDMRAQLAANLTGQRRLASLIDTYGARQLQRYVEEVYDYTARRTAAQLSNLPHGRYCAEGTVDNDGFSDETVHLQAAIELSPDRVRFDLHGCDAQRPGPVNSTLSQTYSACAYVLKSVIDPDTPVNAGFYRFIDVDAPAGTVVNRSHPAPVVGGWETNQRLTDVMFRALLGPMPDVVAASSKAMTCHAGFGALDLERGDYVCFLETLGGGFGGRATGDGPDAVQSGGQNTENAPVEETELSYPVRIERYELVTDSEGAGRHRGGLGIRRDYHFPDAAVTFTILADRDREGPAGALGGQAGRRARYLLNPGPDEVELSSKTTVHLARGDTVRYETCGGGGYGPVLERTREAIVRDVLDGLISAERAVAVYGLAPGDVPSGMQHD
jgi:N-methylhydantoinase B